MSDRVKKVLSGGDIAMPIAVAVWLISNTKLTFSQIADFCNLHPATVYNIGDDDSPSSVLPVNPIGIYLTQDEIERCTQDENARLQLMPNVLDDVSVKLPVTRKYVSLAQKRNRLDGVMWLVSFYPDFAIADISKLAKSTSKMVAKIKDGSYADIRKLVPKNPVVLGLCSRADFNKVLAKYGKQPDDS